MIKTKFEYVDEFGQESKLEKTYTNDVFEIETPIDILVKDFKLFLISAGFLLDTIDTALLLHSQGEEE